MNTRFYSFVLLLTLLACAELAKCQDKYLIGLLPAVNVNARLQKNWSLNTKVESRYLLRTGVIHAESKRVRQYELTDVSLLAAKKIGFNTRIAGGYLMRIENGLLTHRFIQQYAVVQRKSGYRLAHRVVTDQTFFPDEQPEFRLRYRLTAEIPLNGASLDANEFYLKINNEILHRVQARQYQPEYRLVPLLGYDMAQNFKIELGFDYRRADLLSQTQQHSLWVSMNCFVDIGR